MAHVESLRVLPGQRLVFFGDSNTDTEYRTRFPPHGYGYVMFVATMLAASHPQMRLDIVNRGNDGDTVVDLRRRLGRDVLELQPDWLFVLIGTNDVAYRYLPSDGREVDDDTYERTLAEVITATQAQTSARIVLIEPMPYEIPAGVGDEPNHALERLCARIARLAERHGCGLVPVRAELAAIMARGEAAGWYQNFNHPAFPGHAFLGLQVLRHLGWQG